MNQRVLGIVFFLSVCLMYASIANAGCCLGCVKPGVWTCATWIRGSVDGEGHSKTEGDTRGCTPGVNCPEHRQGIFGNQNEDGSACDPRPIKLDGTSEQGCFFKFVYNCVSKQCDCGGILCPKQQCQNQVDSDPNSSHMQDGGGLVEDAEDKACVKTNCRSTKTNVTFALGSFALDCPSGQRPVNAVLDSFFGFLEFCEGGRGDDGTCCRNSQRDTFGNCVDTYGDGCSIQPVEGMCPEGFEDPTDTDKRVVEENCMGGSVILIGEEYMCEASP